MGVMLNHRAWSIILSLRCFLILFQIFNERAATVILYYIIIYDYANLLFNNNDSQLKDGERAEEEKLSETRTTVGLTYWQRRT